MVGMGNFNLAYNFYYLKKVFIIEVISNYLVCSIFRNMDNVIQSKSSHGSYFIDLNDILFYRNIYWCIN